MNTEIIIGVGMFTTVILALVAFILAARSKLVSAGNVNIEINGEKTITVPAGDKLLQTLSNAGLFLPSACGGGGSCAQCKCVITEGGGSMLPTEEGHFNRREAAEGWRLSCQTAVKRLAITSSQVSRLRFQQYSRSSLSDTRIQQCDSAISISLCQTFHDRSSFTPRCLASNSAPSSPSSVTRHSKGAQCHWRWQKTYRVNSLASIPVLA